MREAQTARAILVLASEVQELKERATAIDAIVGVLAERYDVPRTTTIDKSA